MIENYGVSIHSISSLHSVRRIVVSVFISCNMSSESKPIQLSEFVIAIRDLSDENLLLLQKQLTTSTQKLKETNSILEEEISQTTDEEELKLYRETIDENRIVEKSQQRRLDALGEELVSRGLVKEEEGVYL